MNNNNAYSDHSFASENHLALEKKDSQNLSIGLSEDDIEKSIIFNQDGSMTVEMKVRFKIKEKETIQWTTTVSRADLSNNDEKSKVSSFEGRTDDGSSGFKIAACSLSAVVSPLEKGKNQVGSLTENTQTTDPEGETCSSASWENAAMDADAIQETKAQAKYSFYRPPTPGPRRIRWKKPVMASVTLVSETEVQEKMIQQGPGVDKSEYHMFTHSCSKMASVSSKPGLVQLDSNEQIESSLESKKTSGLLKSSMVRSGTVEIMSQKMFNMPRCKDFSQRMLKNLAVGEGRVDNVTTDNQSCIKDFKIDDTGNNTFRPILADVTHSSGNISGVDKTISETPVLVAFSTGTSTNDRRINTFAECDLTMLPKNEKQISSSVVEQEMNLLQQMKNPKYWNGEIAGKKNPSKSERINKRGRNKQDTIFYDSHNAFKGGACCEEDIHSSDMIIKSNYFCSQSHLNTMDSKNFCAKQLTTVQNPKLTGLLAKRKFRPVSKVRLGGPPKIENGEKDKIYACQQLKSFKNSFENKKLFYTFNFLEHKPNAFCGSQVQTDIPPWTPRGMAKKSVLSKVNNFKSQKKPKGDKVKSGCILKKQHPASRENALASDQTILPEDLTQNSIQNYIQRWLQNIDSHLTLQRQKPAPKYQKERSVMSCNNDFPTKNSHTASRKRNQFFRESYSQRTNRGKEIGQSFDEDNSGELTEDLCEIQVGSLTDAKFLSLHECCTGLQSVIDGPSTVRKVSEKLRPAGNPVYQEITLTTKGQSVEVATQVDLLQEDSLKDLMPVPLLQQLQILLFRSHRTQNGIVQIPGSFADDSHPSPSGGLSTSVLLAWLLVLDLRGSMSSFSKGNAHKTANRMSEMFALLEALKQIAITEEADDLKAAVASLVKSTTDLFGLAGKDQDTVYTDPSKNCPASNMWRINKHMENENVQKTSLDGGCCATEDYALQDWNSEVTCSGLMDTTSTMDPPKETQNSSDINPEKYCCPMHQASMSKAAFPRDVCLLPDAGTSLKADEEIHSCKAFCLMDETYSPIQDHSTADFLHPGENTYINKLELTKELERNDKFQSDLNILIDSEYKHVFFTVPSHENTSNFSHCDSFVKTTKLKSEKGHSFGGEFQNCSLKKFRDKNAFMHFDKEESKTSEEPRSITSSITSSEINNIAQLETLDELENQDSDKLHNIKEHEKEQITKELFYKELDADKNLQLMEIPVKNISEERKRSIYETISGRLETPPALMFCYDSKQNTEKQLLEGETKMKWKVMGGTLEIGSYSDPSLDFKKCFKNPVNPNSSVCNQDDTNKQPHKISSDGPKDGDQKELRKGFVKKKIEKFYGKADVKKPSFFSGSLHRTQVCPYNSLEFPGAEKVSLHDSENQSSNSSFQISSGSSTLQKLQGQRQDMCDFNDERASYGRDIVKHGAKKEHSHTTRRDSEEGILIDRGKWLLRENHLLRLSSTENSGLCGSADTASVDMLHDSNPEVPYSHFGNLVPSASIAELSSLEPDELIQPLEPNYFNMPHSNDVEPFRQDLAGAPIKSHATERIPNDCAGEKSGHRPETVCTSMTQVFTSGNKVHPISDNVIKTQPFPATSVLPTLLQEGDSLDKLYAICGQHCPILTVIIQPINEEDRGFAYGQLSDIENSLGIHLWMKIRPHLSQSNKNTFRDENNKANRRKSFIDNAINNMSDRLYFNNTFVLMDKREKLKIITFLNLAEENLNDNNLKRFQSFLKKKIPANFRQKSLFVVDELNSTYSNISDSNSEKNEIFEVVDENNNILFTRFQSSKTNL